MEHENYDLENKINLIYDYNYNINNKNCFSFDKITMGKISLNDIKISLPDSDQESIEYYEANKSDVLNGKFKLLNYDEESNIIFLKKYSNQFPINVKISFYTDIKKIESFDNKINNDSLFSYLSSQLVLSKKTNHIQLPIMNIDIKFNEIEHFITNDSSHSKIKKQIINGTILDTCCLQLREHFFKSITIEDYLNENKCAYKPLLFQIIHTLAVLQNEFDGFRHNNLTLNNIFVYLKRTSESYVEYSGFKDNKFYLPNSGFDIKISNFEHSIIPKFYGMSNYSNPSIKFANQPNQYYDLFTFLNDLLEGTTMMSLHKEGNKCDIETKKFLDIIFPPHMRGLNNEKMTKNIIIARPIDLLDDKYFDEFRNKPSKNYIQESLTNHQYLTGRVFDTFMDSDNYSILGQQDKIKSNYNIMSKEDRRTIKEDRRTIKEDRRTIKEDRRTIKEDRRTIKEDKNKSNYNIMTKEDKIKRISKKGGKILDDIDEDIVESKSLNSSRRILKEEYSESEVEKIKRYNNKNLKGGSEKVEATPYKAEKNNPFITNEQREINKKRSIENPVREPPVILEQKLYDTSQKPVSKPTFPPAFIPLYDEKGSVANQLLPYTHIQNQPPIQKVYNLNLTGPTANLSAINKVYEDVLPGDHRTFTALSIFERKQLIDFLRNSMLDTMDGEEMNISGGRNSLLSYIKLMDLNPYTLNKNPYLDLARNFLLYRAAYPVRYDDKTKFIGIGKPSMGINIRMYMMSLGDLRCKTIGKNVNADNFDLWREIKYYDCIRDDIIKRKVSPNFIAPILYKIDSESKIDWTKLDVLRTSGFTNETIKELKINQQLINEKHKLPSSKSLFNSLIPNYYQKNVTVTNNNKAPLQEEEKEDLTKNSGKMLILLTEAPNTNILQWSSTIYDSFGSIKKMMSSGYHTPDVWKSILFQLVYACAVLQKKEIYIENFSLENNIYIKDIFSDPNAVGSWIYKVNNVDYYIPNFGYILLVDSKYTDINIDQSFIKKPQNLEQKFKIYGSIYSKNPNFDMVSIKNQIMIQFRSIIDPDNFRHKMKVKGGSNPPEEIIDLLQKMHNENLSDIKDFIPNYFGEYVHNRIGSLLTKSEVENINLLSKPRFLKGNLMIYQERANQYIWVIYIDKVVSPNDLKCVILKKDLNNQYKKEEVFKKKLYGYPENEKIYPETKKNMKYDESHIYESYNIDSIN